MKYSIITINYNHAEGLRRTIESVVNQTCKDYEYIVIDGGSTDGSVDVIKEYADKIDFWVSEPDNGIYNAMNKGIEHAHGEYLNFMNSGDCFYTPTVLEEFMPLLTTDIVFGKARAENGDTFGPRTKEITLYDLCIYGFNHQATFYKEALFANHLYDESYKILGDWKFTAESLALSSCSYRVEDKLVAKYDLAGISSSNKALVNAEHRKILETLLPPAISRDYILFTQMRSPLLNYIPYLRKSYRAHKIAVALVRIVVKISKLFTTIKGKR